MDERLQKIKINANTFDVRPIEIDVRIARGLSRCIQLFGLD